MKIGEVRLTSDSSKNTAELPWRRVVASGMAFLALGGCTPLDQLQDNQPQTIQVERGDPLWPEDANFNLLSYPDPCGVAAIDAEVEVARERTAHGIDGSVKIIHVVPVEPLGGLATGCEGPNVAILGKTYQLPPGVQPF